MTMSFPPAQLVRFRQEAKKLGREASIPHSEALDRVAVKNGFANWSLLAKHSNSAEVLASRARTPQPESPRSIRYYLHGDIRETDPSQCYCARCDVFWPHDHLLPVSHHADGKDGERFLRDLASWNALTRDERGLNFRPQAAPNILSALATAARDAREAARSPFHRWLDHQRRRNDPVGDLASDILRDAAFPIGLATRRELEEHLDIYGSHVKKALRQAWREFKGGDRLALTRADALAAELKISREEAQELVDVEPIELTGHSGDGAYGYEFDFSRHASPKLAATLMRKHRSLTLRVGPWFYDGIEGSEFSR